MSFAVEKAGHVYYEQAFEIKPLRYIDVPKAARCSADAFRSDSESLYLADADTAPFPDQRAYLRQFALLTDGVHGLTTFTINGGESLIIIGEGPRKGRGPLGSIVQPILDAVVSEEYIKRRNSIGDKARELIKAAFPDGTESMIEIRLLSTAPEKQGRGYASALMKVVNEIGDAQDRGVYAITSDAFRFYEANGYTVLQEGFVGGDNPKWHGPPVGIRIVYRAQKSGLPSEKGP